MLGNVPVEADTVFVKSLGHVLTTAPFLPPISIRRIQKAMRLELAPPAAYLRGLAPRQNVGIRRSRAIELADSTP